MKLKNLSTRTINTYVSLVSNFARHFRQSPQHLGRDDVRSYRRHPPVLKMVGDDHFVTGPR